MSEIVRSRLSRFTRDWFVGSVLEPTADAYVRYLLNRGYAGGTIDGYARSVAHFAHWLKRRRIGIEDLGEAVVAHFLDEHLSNCRCARHCQRGIAEVRAALAHLLELLRMDGLLVPPAPSFPAGIVAELCEFDRYLTDVRGLCAVTRQAHVTRVRKFLLSHFGDGDVQIETMTAAKIMQYIMKITAGWKPSSVNAVSHSLRSYLRFKAVRGARTTPLIAALPRVAQWRLSGLPRVLSADETRRLLEVFDRNTAAGRRDRAIARCYVDLGLRTSEIARLQLDDLDWRGGVVRVRGKGRRIDILPLPAATGRSIVEYLRKGRRPTASRALFLRHRPPLDMPASSDTIRAAIRNAARRCGLGERLTGPHILRHTIAKRLVEHGATLKDIADLLRHRCLDTTTIYAKVDLDALRKVAAPWPEGQS